MVKRGVVINISTNLKSNWDLLFFIAKKLHRYYFYYIFLAVIFGFIGYLYNPNIQIIVFSVLIIESLFLSIAIHEMNHYSFAKFLYLKTISFSIIPYKFETYINFSPDEEMNDEDFAAILISGSLFTIIILILLFGIIILFVKRVFPSLDYFYVYIIFAVSVIFNIFALLPLKKSDGGKAYRILREHKGAVKRVMGLYLFYLSVILKVNPHDMLKELRSENIKLKK